MSESTNPTPGGGKHTVLKAQEFVLTDAGGTVRAQFGMDANGIPGLRFLDKSGTSRMELFVLEDGVPAIKMFDAEGKNKAVLFLRDGECGTLRLLGLTTRLDVSLDYEDGDSVVALEREGMARAALYMNRRDDHVGLALVGRTGNPRADLWIDCESGAKLLVSDVKGFERITLDESGLDITDEHGRFVWSSRAGFQSKLPDDMDEDEHDGEEGEADDAVFPEFDPLFKKPVSIPLFIWDDGVRPFQGYCRNRVPVSKRKPWEHAMGVFTAEGKHFSVLIDTRVRCALPQFFIDEKPFHFAIVSISTMGAWVDPETGDLKAAPLPQQGESGLQGSPTARQVSTGAGKPTDKPTSSEHTQ